MSLSKPIEIEVEVDGKTYKGHYSDDGRVLTVFCALGKVTTHSGPHMAHQLLRELIDSAKTRGML